jgi:pimeloyl-ACP methyl ester carboxylesterase
MISAYLQYKNSQIHYRKSGGGNKLAICFHGFGSYANTFDWIAQHVPDHTFIAIDLPYHGLTQWTESDTLKAEELIRILDLCPDISGRNFALAGFSMGGRIALSILQQVPSRITRLVLLAPDGLHMNRWYWFATQTAMGNRIFHHVMYKPERFVKLVRKAGKYRLVNKGILKFIDRYLDDESVRHHVYQVWTALRKFRPDIHKIEEEIQHRNIPVRLIYGKFDNIIPFIPGKMFSSHLGRQSRFTVLECGHQVLHIRNAQYIADTFNLPQ